ncbi:M24 family metallopeptidase [Tropicimonas isoalkanivorans]|uniref:Xaa-Pro dipeptidase n=1 Tax=Tropicimonas isoalkanivorans TaxID=441112 RepID=A0A1I1HUC3_9RHOB|nr:Xaa-Pro peptidase family protein [Tropicimonas isoalkanivorans]SFC25548.1 Xaa-Pro dipeptidase [Tropicimonas isoalkanivorans]
MDRFTGFSREEYAARQEALRSRMEAERLDAIVVSAPENILYLTGYQTKAVFTFQFLLFLRSGPLELFTRQMEYVNARDAVRAGGLDDFVVFQDDEDPIEVSSGFLARRLGAGQKVGLELASWTMSAQRAADITASHTGVDWIDVSSLIDRMRLVKRPAELDVMREAGRIGDKVSNSVGQVIAAGRSENDLSAMVLSAMIAYGSEYPGSWPNITSGIRTGLIHATWEGTVIEADDHVVTEVTGVRGRYHAPSMRVTLVGKPEPAIERGAEALVKAQAAAVAAMEPGAPMRVINDAAMAVLDGMNHGLTLARRSGYSLGLGFPPSWGAQWQLGLNSVVEMPLEIGMTFHVVCVGHLPDGKAVAIGSTAALGPEGPEALTRGGLYRV